jgi:heterodisulfide reductase subunit A-like polyferredoxin
MPAIVTFKDLILDEENTIAADLVVLATGQVPNSGVDIEAWNRWCSAAEPAEAAEGASRIGEVIDSSPPSRS